MGTYENELIVINKKLEELKNLINYADSKKQEIASLVKILEEKEPEYKSLKEKCMKATNLEAVELLLEETERSNKEIVKSMVLSGDIDYLAGQFSGKITDSINIKID